MPPYRLGRHWNTIQAYLIPDLEDDIGELSEELKKFMGICELLIDEKMVAKYRWCWNGRLHAATFLFFNEFHVHFSLPFGKETTLDCLPMASKPVSAAVFALLVHVFSSSIRAVCHLEHPRIKIYTLYTFYTAIKEGFAKFRHPRGTPILHFTLYTLPARWRVLGTALRRAGMICRIRYRDGTMPFLPINNTSLTLFHKKCKIPSFSSLENL